MPGRCRAATTMSLPAARPTVTVGWSKVRRSTGASMASISRTMRWDMSRAPSGKLVRVGRRAIDVQRAGCEVSGVGERGAAGGAEIVADEVEPRDAAQQRGAGERLGAARADLVA